MGGFELILILLLAGGGGALYYFLKIRKDRNTGPITVKKDTQSSSGWISGMRIFAWVTFAVIIIGGIILAVQAGQDNGFIAFAILIGSVVGAFLTVAMLMIFLDLAQGVSKITQDITDTKELIKK